MIEMEDRQESTWAGGGNVEFRSGQSDVAQYIAMHATTRWEIQAWADGQSSSQLSSAGLDPSHGPRLAHEAQSLAWAGGRAGEATRET